jgi:uncharacterized protein YndB with AHSA1/START domain
VTVVREIADRTVVLRRRYEADIEDVWSAWTEPERLNRWFLPVSGDLREGGSFSLEGDASGEILACERPRRLRVTWVYGDRPVDEVELRLMPDGDGTLVELSHATAAELVEYGGARVDAVPGIGAGWELPVAYLDRYLRGELPDAPSSEWFEFTPEIIEQDRQNTLAWEALSPRVVVERVVPAGRARVFRAWLDADEVAQWWGPGGPFTVPRSSVDIDPRAGGRLYLTMIDGGSGTEFPVRYSIDELVEPELLVLTMPAAPETGLTDATTVRIHFDEVDGGTRITVFAGPYDEQLRPNAAAGWNNQMDTFVRRFGG